MLKIALKDIKLLLKDKRTMLVTFALPIVIITVFAFAFGGVGGDDEVKEYYLPIADLDNSAASKNTISIIDSTKTIQAVKMELVEAQETVKKGENDCVFIIHRGFSDSLANGKPLPVELQYDEAREVQVSMMQQTLYMSLAEIRYSIPLDTAAMPLQLRPTVNINASSNANDEIKMTKLVGEKEDNALGLIHAVAGTAIMMLLFSVAGMGASLLDEKQEGTLKKLLYSPMKPNNILFGKMIAANIISITQLSIMFIFAKLAFGLDIMNHLPALILMIIITSYACSSFGVFLASFAKSRQQVQSLSTMVVLIMSLIGGSMIPIFIMPDFMQQISVISVNYWGIQGFYDIFWRMLSVTDVTFLSRILVLFLYGTTLNLLALWMFNRNILKIA